MSLLRVPLPRRPRPGLPVGFTATPQRTFLSRSRERSTTVVENLNVQKLSQKTHDYNRNRKNFLLAGAVAGLVSFSFTAWKLKQQLAKNPIRQDSGLPSTDIHALVGAAVDRKVIVHDEKGREIVPTGNATVPDFPRIIWLPSQSSSSFAADGRDTAAPAPELGLDTTEYTLVGLGLRTVSFLGIQVYVVGFYVATADVAALQAALIKKINPIATTLVPDERDQLRAQLLSAAEGDDIWNGLLKDGLPARSLFRVVPVRDTDFHHLRDGFVRALQARSDRLAIDPGTNGAAEQADFDESVRQFRRLFDRGSVPKRKELLLHRGAQGSLSVMYDDGASHPDRRPLGGRLLGVVQDERISRALWLHYLAGKKVASEPARRNIVEGIMEFVERPVGTVASQVVAVVP